jgi:hypothetical protein
MQPLDGQVNFTTASLNGLSVEERAELFLRSDDRNGYTYTIDISQSKDEAREYMDYLIELGFELYKIKIPCAYSLENPVVFRRQIVETKPTIMDGLMSLIGYKRAR